MNALELFALIAVVSLFVFVLTGTLYDWTPKLIIENTRASLIKAGLILSAGFVMLNLLAAIAIYHFAGSLALIWTLVPVYVCYRTVNYCRSLYKNDMYFYLKRNWSELNTKEKIAKVF
jgi:hypothetical protein